MPSQQTEETRTEDKNMFFSNLHTREFVTSLICKIFYEKKKFQAGINVMPITHAMTKLETSTRVRCSEKASHKQQKENPEYIIAISTQTPLPRSRNRENSPLAMKAAKQENRNSFTVPNSKLSVKESMDICI